MSTNLHRLDCNTGCCLDKIKHLTEQIFHEQDDMYNQLAEENINMGNFVVDVIVPYLSARADSKDERAQDLLIELNNLLRGV